jgi:hypothetical protein
MEKADRAGVYVNQLSGELHYRAFIPKPLPPDPPITMDRELWQSLSNADRAPGHPRNHQCRLRGDERNTVCHQCRLLLPP